VPCANAELETATRTAAAVNTVFNFMSMLPVGKTVASRDLLLNQATRNLFRHAPTR
jgi:hypothetical protein